ncbi:Dolichyl-diphosphooligosaccharide--protein glycosyltransferase subunit 2 [Vanrija pseudolonga]|uniref:Ribophorin II n=1 Tax=Vanrija pseudolonga TaxID=143232 RepID=A0AAF0XZ24_9TREE|nr:Dolichyl-diphosphooligosaccharide--protein glycosyltransferase subunit 2 [Vanrija pseudolonga]
MRGIRRALAAALVAASAVTAASSSLAIKGGKAVVSLGGVSDDALVFTKTSGWTTPLALPSAATLKLAFSIVDSDSGEGVVPKAAFVALSDDSGEEVVLQVGVKANGKATYFLDTAKPPLGLAVTSGALNARLLLSDGDARKPLSFPLGVLELPGSGEPARKRHSLPPRAGEPAFAEQGYLFHTFKEEEREIAFVKSVTGVVGVLAPWALLVLLINNVAPNLQFQTPPTAMYAFLACLVGLEGLILRYWIGWRLYQLLPPFLALAAVTAYVGTVALRAARAQRLKAGGAP